MPADQRATLKARQGVPYVVQEALMVADPDHPGAGAKGWRDHGRADDARQRAHEGLFEGRGGHGGGLCWGAGSTPAISASGIADGYAEIRDRAKDIIISGGENISTIEVESVLYRHPAVLEAAVVARPDVKWGRDPMRLRDPEAGCRGDRGRDHRILPRPYRALHGAPDGGVRRAAEDVDREDAEIPAPGPGPRARLGHHPPVCGQPVG